ncbi:MAG: serine/threonine-protein kinase [Myxococcota bacterium]
MADPTTRPEGSADRADQASGDSGSSGSVFASERDDPNDPMTTVEARIIGAPFQAPPRPTMLGRYVVLGTLGQGGMGTVLEAFDRTLDRKVAVKVLHEDLGPEHTARLLREARAMAKLSHPNVVPVFEADTTDGQTFVAMELVQGQTLRAWMRQSPPPDWRQCVEVFIEVGLGLAAAHAEGLVHRDFKPSNAIVDDKGRARVLDFGLARRIGIDRVEDERPDRAQGKTDDDLSVGPPGRQRAPSQTMPVRGDDEPALDLLSVQTLTKTGVVMGTPAYMPLEQIRGREADARSDQFSFCVSLYEAVYRERPFEGGTLTGLLAAMTEGSIRPAPKGNVVPARLRTILLRGLAIDPAERWPSMDALLHQLRALVAPRTRRWVALGVTVGLVGLGAMLALGQYVEVKDRCTGARAQMDGIWDDDRRQQVQAAILGTERSFAASTWDRIEPRLDAYADTWMHTHTAACEATSVRGEQSAEALDLRMRCLDRRRTALRAAVDVLADADANADAKVVTHAVELVADLPPLARCDDLSWLERHDQRVPPPEDPVVAAAVQIQRARLADIETMHKAGRYAEALDAVQEVLEQAETLGYLPLRAEALHWRGELREKQGQYTQAEQDLRQAHALAMEMNHDPVALDTAQLLSGVVGLRLARHTEGQQWGEMDALPLARRSGDPVEEATSLRNLGNVFYGQGDYDNARVHYQRALAIEQEALGPDHPQVAYTHNNLGAVLVGQGDIDNAERHHQRALALWQNVLGPDHPNVASSLNNLGTVLAMHGEIDNAKRHHQRARAIWQSALGPDHPYVASSLVGLGVVSHRQGDLDTARVHFRRALAIFENAQGPDHPDVVDPLLGLAMVALDKDDAASARGHAERAVSICESATVAPTLLAEVRFVLAQALWSQQGERARARMLAEQARDALTAAQGPGASSVDLAKIDAWLATHRVQ